jgi:hypothetical protein
VVKITKVFEFGKGEYGPGMRPINEPHADFLGGLGVAHDTIEHFKNVPESFGVAGELMAFGAMLHLRYDSGYLMSNPYWRAKTFVDWLARDAAEVVLHHLRGDCSFQELRREPRTSTFCDMDWARDQLSDWDEEVMASACAEFPYEVAGLEDHDGILYTDNGYPDADWKRVISASKPWVLLGYQKACRKFSNVDSGSYAEVVFEWIEEESDKIFRLVDKWERDYHRLVVHCHTDNYAAKMKLYRVNEETGKFSYSDFYLEQEESNGYNAR